jgi:hypothetical protein
MPRATVDLGDTKHYDLETCPEGFVELRKLSYGEWLERRDMAAKMIAEGDGSGKVEEVSVMMMQRKVTLYELSKAVVDHNLTDNSDQPLNFQRSNILDILDPRIGQEIGKYITEMNAFQDAFLMYVLKAIAELRYERSELDRKAAERAARST